MADDAQRAGPVVVPPGNRRGRERSGGIVAAVTLTVPRSEFGTTREKDDLITAVCGAAIELSMPMGYRPYDGDPTARLAARRTEKTE